MTTRRPSVLVDGYFAELPSGDSVNAGAVPTQVVAGSGLSGGGAVSTSPRLDVSLASNPSGIIFVGDALGFDGAAQVSANAGLASGNAAIVVANNALASGNNSLVVASAALASGNAALAVLPTLNPDTRNKITLTAAGPIVSGYAVGVDDTGQVQSINRLSGGDFSPPFINSFTTVVTRQFPTFHPQSLVSSSFDNSFALAYADNFNSSYPTVVGGVINGTTASVGTPTVLNSVRTTSIAGCFASAENKYFYSFNTDPGAASLTAGLVVSGTTVFVGTPQTHYTGATVTVGCTYYPDQNKVITLHQGSVSGLVNVGTISGLSLNLGPSNIVFSGFLYSKSIAAVNVPSTNSFIYGGYIDPVAANNPFTGYGLFRVYENVVSGLFYRNINTGFDLILTGPGSSLVYATASSGALFSFRERTIRYSVTYFLQASGNTILTGPSGVIPDQSATSLAYDPVSNKSLITNVSASAGVTRLVVRSVTVSGLSVIINPVSGQAFINNLTSEMSSSYNPATNRFVIAASSTQYSGIATVLDPFQTYGYTPRVGSFPNVLGVAQSTVASGSPCVVALPGSTYTQPSGNFQTGAFYYADPTTSGLTTSATSAALWSGQTPWNYIGRAISASGISVLKTL